MKNLLDKVKNRSVKERSAESEKLSALEFRRQAQYGLDIDRNLWPDEYVRFIDSLDKVGPNRYDLHQALQQEPHQFLAFSENLELTIAYEKRNPEKVAEQRNIEQEQAAKIERKRAEAAAAVEAKRVEQEQAEEAARQREKDQLAQRELDKKKEEAASRKAALERKKNPLIHCPVERKERSDANRKIVLEFLRHERYSNVKVMALVLRMTMPGARKVLNRLVGEGWLVRDEVPWVGCREDMHLFGVSSRALGLIEVMWPEDIMPRKNRVFNRKKTSPNSGHHVLNNQLARLYLQRVENPMGRVERHYTPDRDLPGKGLKDKGWGEHGKFPDGVVRNSHYGVTVAIETERYDKGIPNYEYLIRQHLYNIEKNRYGLVIHYMETQEIAAGLRARFHQIIEERATQEDRDSGQVERDKDRFLFDVYKGLEKRIEELG